LGLIFNGAFAMPSAILTREFRQDKRAYADLTGFVVGTVTTMVLAVMGYGPWALAWGRFIGNAVVSLMQVAFVPQRFRPGWDRHVALDLLRSGLPLGARPWWR
jgi:O-antigen/teichoic acid export membrane protein